MWIINANWPQNLVWGTKLFSNFSYFVTTWSWDLVYELSTHNENSKLVSTCKKLNILNGWPYSSSIERKNPPLHQWGHLGEDPWSPPCCQMLSNNKHDLPIWNEGSVNKTHEHLYVLLQIIINGKHPRCLLWWLNDVENIGSNLNLIHWKFHVI